MSASKSKGSQSRESHLLSQVNHQPMLNNFSADPPAVSAVILESFEQDSSHYIMAIAFIFRMVASETKLDCKSFHGAKALHMYDTTNVYKQLTVYSQTSASGPSEIGT